LRPNARGPGLVTFGVWPYDYYVAVNSRYFLFIITYQVLSIPY
jgi:hypothetical protein